MTAGEVRAFELDYVRDDADCTIVRVVLRGKAGRRGSLGGTVRPPRRGGP